MNYPTLETLRQYEADGWVRSSRHPILPLTIFTYTHAAQYENHWDDVIKIARGLVFDDLGNLVQVPMSKMFNQSDPNSPQWGNRQFTAYDKMDGSLILVTMWAGNKVISTKGSFTSPMAIDAERFLEGWQPPEGFTVFFEYIVPENRIVVDYGDYEGLWLLGAVRHDTGYDGYSPAEVVEATGWYGDFCVPRTFNMGNMIRTISDVENGEGREGFVVVIDMGEGRPTERFKMKFAKYVEMHALMSGLTNKRVWEMVRDGDVDKASKVFPDETFQIIVDYHQELTREVSRVLSIADQIYSMAIKADPDDRRTQAEEINSPVWDSVKGCRPIAFAFLDNDLVKARKIAVQMVKPENTTPLIQGL
jgi:RNA ligase